MSVNTCSFCGSTEFKKIIQGQDQNVFICDSCIEIGYDLILCDKKPKNVQIDINPKSIKRKLDEYIIGQEIPKKVLSVAIYNHMLKIKRKLTDVQKGNILLIGPTGSGKTLLAKTLAATLDVPFVVTDATTLTESGYVGEDVESILQPLLQKCDFDVDMASRGIVYVDEIDKKSRKTASNPSVTRDVSGEGVQYGLLKLIEGTMANVHAIGTRKHPQSNCTQIDTSNILFILGGAFCGLSKIISDRLGRNEVGFGNKQKISKTMMETELLKQIEPDDLIQFGLIPELVGRMPVLAVLDELQIDDLVRILTEPKDNLISQYKTLLYCDGINIKFPDDTIKKIAQTAFDKKIGARGLKSVIEKIMLDFMFEVNRKDGGEYTIEI